MSIERVRNLARKWFPAEGGSFQSALDHEFDKIGFTGDSGYVETAIEANRTGRASRKEKVVKDNVWGMVEVDWQSIRLLDSPVVQRLRGIKQLGFSYLTYPSAEHSRFVHSLGMYCVVSRFLDVMSRRGREYQDRSSSDDAATYEVWEPNAKLISDLRHAAILHDIGHMPFSHASEAVFETHQSEMTCGPKSVDDFRFDVEETLETTLRFAECLALAVVLSPRFRNFYDNFVRPGGGDPDTSIKYLGLQVTSKSTRRFLKLLSVSPLSAGKATGV